MSKIFDGKVVIVTGSNSGIGEATAILFAKKGAKVTLCGRDEERLQAAKKKCQDAAGHGADRYLTVQGDITKATTREQIVKKTVEKFGRLDVLVSSVGINKPSPGIMGVTDELYDEIMNTNLKAAFFTIQAALPELEKTKGSIVCVSAMLSTLPFPPAINYCMSKAALDHMTRNLALELAPKGIRVNTINPSQVGGTRMLRHITANIEDMEKLSKAVSSKHPLGGRAGRPEEHAEFIAFLASDQASFCTGQCIKVDGALTLRGMS